nr:heavy metal-associated isoprenylated plant protein 39 [Tanacetum cinerariifolium]
MAQKVVLKLISMIDDKTKQKAIEGAADIYGVDSIAADLKDQKLTVVGDMDAVALVKKLVKVVGIVDIESVGPMAPPEPQPVPETKNVKKKIKKKKKKNKDNKGEEKENRQEEKEEEIDVEEY